MDISNYTIHHRQLDLVSTPVALFESLYTNDSYGFIYESLENMGGRGRYSFIGGKPFLVMRARGDIIDVECRGHHRQTRGNSLECLKVWLNDVPHPPVKPFPGGALGYLSYDVVRQFERIPDDNPDNLDVPDAYFIFPGEIIVFDHQEQTLDVVVTLSEDESGRLDSVLSKIHESPEATEFDLYECVGKYREDIKVKNIMEEAQ